MGNKFSLSIRLDHGNDGDIPIEAGTTLKGTVTLKVKRKMDASELSLHLIGTETTIISPRPGKVSKDEKRIARAVMVLKECGRNNHKISKGTYAIPFEFALPSSLPASTQFPKVNARAFNGRIKYVLQAKLAPGYMEERTFLIDSAPLPSDIVPCMAQPTTHELKTFGLLNKGFLSVGASVENSRAGRGRTIRVSVASRNDASVDLERVRVKLVELIEFHALEEKSSLKVELGKLKDIDLPGLDKTKGNGMDVRRKIRQGFERSVESTYQAIYQDLVSADNQIEIIVPETARDSYDGNLMTISHYLKVTFFTKALVENPSTKIPIVIGNPGDPERQQPATPGRRNPNEPIATVIYDDEIDLSGEESRIEVGSRAEEPMTGAPMVNAVLLDQHHRLGMELPEQDPNNDTIIIGSENVILCEDDSQSFFSAQEVEAPPTGSVPSAPSESLLREHRTPTRSAGNVHRPLGVQNHPPSPQGGAYSPYQMYTQQQRRPNMEYSYEDSDLTSTITEADYRTPRSQGLVDRLIQELNGSIHDYEVIANKLRDSGYQEIFQTLTAKEFDRVIRNVSMNHQVKVACLLAKQVKTFLCAHCAAAVAATSEYFRSNMVEALLPFCSDFPANRQIIEEGLSEWEQIITRHAMENTTRGSI